MFNPCNRETPPVGFPRYALGLALAPLCYRTSPRASIPVMSRPNIIVVTAGTQAYANLALPESGTAIVGSSSPKTGKKHPPGPKDEELGLWVDSSVIAKQLKQPTQSLFVRAQHPSAERLLHFADLALGSIKPDKFKAQKVSKKRPNS
jgi:hypothetical protein